MPKIAGKQIKDAPDGIDTININDGALSADAAGRAKVAAGFFDAPTVDAKFSTGAIALAKLAEAPLQADGGQAFTGDQDADGYQLNNLGTPTGPDSAARLRDVNASLTWKELLLHPLQLLDGGTGGVLQAIALYLATNPSDGQTFILTDGTTTEVFTFKNAPAGAFDVQIGGTAAITQANLISQINTDSALWSATAATTLDAYFAAVPPDQVVIYRTLVSTNPDRCYGSAAGIQIYEFDNDSKGYVDVAGDGEKALPAADPTTKSFGIGRAFGDLIQNETHKITDNTDYTWDGDDQIWQQTGVGLIVYATAGQLSTIDAGDAAVGGILDITARGDHQHAVSTGGNTTSIDAGDAAAEGTSTNLAREDHQHPVSTGTPGTIEPDDAADEGVSTDLARADHTHAIVADTPVGLGTANQEGAGTAFARNNHVHRRDDFTQEEVTTQTINNVDVALTDTLDNVPIAARGILLFLNGVLQIPGVGNDYTLSGQTITWLAGTGTAPNMKTTDELIAAYWY